MSNTFGVRLRELRKAKELSLRDLATFVGVDFTYLSKLEMGISKYSPSAWLLHQLAEHLGANEDELTNLAGKVPAGLKKRMQDNPLLTELVRVLSDKRLPDEIYRKMIELAKEQS